MQPRLVTVLASIAWFAQAGYPAVRCDLGTPKSQGACIDPKNLNGKTVRVPANVTRIGSDGLALCTPKNVSILSADIAYVIDNSASMSSSVFWVDSATKDTSWFIQDCKSTVNGPSIALRKRHFGGTTGIDSLQWDTLVEASGNVSPGTLNPSRCWESNDPYSWRAQVVRLTANYQASFDSGSQAGAIFFNSGVTQKFPMRPLGKAGLADLLVKTGMYKAASGTNWAPPLDSAMRWLSNTPATGRSKAIVLVSDGEPADSGKYMPLLRRTASPPPIYAVYLGKWSDPTPEIDRVTALTKGKKFVVPPGRPDSLEEVLKTIVASVTTKDAPTGSTLFNATNGQRSKTISVTGDAFDAWHLRLDSTVALATGPNSLTWVSSWKTLSGIAYDTSVFLLDVSGPSDPSGESAIAGSPFTAICAEGSQLQFLDSSWNQTNVLTDASNKFGIRLTPSGGDFLPSKVQIAGSLDTESLALAAKDSLPLESWGRQVPLAVNSIAKRDQTIQSRPGLDTLHATWCQVRDPRDCADASVEVQSLHAAQLRWMPRTTTGPAGALVLEGILPRETTNSVKVPVFRHGLLVATMTLTRVHDSLFRDTIAFLQGPRRPGGDTLWLASPPATHPDSLVASVTWGPQQIPLGDVALINRPPLALSLSFVPDRPQDVQIKLAGGTPDARGGAKVTLVGPTAIPPVDLVASSPLAWNGDRALSGLLPESADSIAIKGRFVDPTYGDTAWATVRISAPWSAARIEVSEELADPRGLDTVEIRVYDKDVDSLKVGKVKVSIGTRVVELTETGVHTGKYTLRLPASKIDPNWLHHLPRDPWPVELVYTDPDHPTDVARTKMRLRFDVPPPVINPRETVLPVNTQVAPGSPVLMAVRPDYTGTYPKGTQGVELKIWERTHVMVYLFDNLGVSVSSWESTLEPMDATSSTKFVVRWNGLDEHGNPAAPGVYIMRAVLVGVDSKPLGNVLYKIGRKR